MSSRYPPSSGFNSRDRSPQRFGDRRPPAGPRGSDDANSAPLGREPPRGPKALIDHPRGAPFGGRGRGFPGRAEFRDRDRDPRDRDRERDRDFRDPRDGPPPFRRDIDRDWPRRERDFDPRDSRIGFGRGRSRSPPPPPRDFRDMREPVGRDSDIVRMRRGSRDSLVSVSSNAPDGPALGPNHIPRGGPMRGRGRGDWEGGRGRGRVPYLDDRDSFRRRSRSRDGRRDWERDRERDRDRDREREVRDRVVDRERERERERDRERIVDRDRERDIDRRDRERERDIIDRRDRFERRDDLDRPRDRDERDRPAEAWKRDQPPVRADTRTTSGAHPLGSLGPVPAASDRLPDHPIVEPPRKPSMAEARRDSIRPDLAASRPDSVKELPLLPIQRSPPPAAPQVPAFGSVTAPIPDLSADKVAVDTTSAEVAPSVAEKERSQPPSRAPVQPPTGPKAERASVQPSPEQRFRREEVRRDEGLETSEKDSFIPRAPKIHVSPSLQVRKQTPELSPPTAPAAMIGKEMSTPHGEASLTGRTGSRVTSPELNKGRTPSVGATSPGLHIPTGPRALQQRPTPTRGPPKGKTQWARPGYSWHPTGPGAVPPPKRDSIDGKERSLSMSEEPKREPPAPADEHGTELEAGEILPDKEIEGEARRSPEPLKSDAIRHVTPPRAPQADVKSEKKVTPEDKPAMQEDALIPDFGRSSDEDEDETVFTQEYLEERKQIFEKDMKALRVEMPPSPLEDPHIVSLLMQIQLLGVLANEQAPGEAALPSAPPVEVPKAAAEAGEPAPIVVKQDAELETPGTSPKLALDLPPVDSISVKDLPFLQSGPPTPISDLDIYQENAAIYARMKGVFSQELIQQRKEIARKNAELREVYLSYYKPWRLHVWELDRAKARASSTPRAATPQAPPAAPTPPVAEGRRYKGNSELDFQMALRASEISAQEELERRRGNKATAQPDLAREAVIPDMLEPKEAKVQVYKDTNNTVDPAKAKDVFGFIPPPNDFTPEEHEIFTDAFMAYPKKWGKIAEALPGRDFQQCIIHYYLTKEEIKYKAKLNKRWSRRGRARRSARPKSNALMKDLGVVKPDYDGEEEPAPVTDTGRPRRAAAPTFGDSSAADTDTNGRRGAGKDGEPGEKPSRRGGRTGTGTRGNRRGKAAQQQQQPQQQQQAQPLPQPPAQVSKVPHPGGPEQPMQTFPVPSVAVPVVPPPKTEPSETFMAGVTEPVRIKETIEREITEAPRAKAGRGRQREGMYVFESAEQEILGSARQAEGGYGSLQPTSYWSVPEQRDFPQLLAHFGRDFEGISNFMKTKTTVMVKNYFQRRVDSGQKDLEEIVADAEAKKARGERTGPLPVPNFASKRRYEATPSSIMPRPLAPHSDTVTEEEGRTAKTKHTATPSQLAPLHARPPPEKERSVSRYPPLAQASNVPMSAAPMLVEDPSRAIRSQVGLPPRLQGPRLGYFTEERRDAPATLAHANVRPQEVPLSARQTPVPVSEMPRMEPLHAQSFRTASMDMHGSPLLAAQGSIPPSQQAYMQQQQQPQHVFMPSATHSRQRSLTKPPGSPAQPLQRQEAEISPIRRDSTSQRPFYPLPGQHAGLSQPPILSPPKEPPRPRSTPLEPAEAPRQVPAKRSNIMSILNDEPEEPQPRKRFASDQASSNAPGKPGSPSRPVYSGAHSLPQQAPSRQDERQSLYAPHGQYLPPSRAYSDYQAYSAMPGGSPAPPANNDWMARFDPRGQQQQQQPAPPQPSQPSNRPATTLAAQPSYSPYTSGQSLPPPSLPNLTAPSPVPTPSPAPTQRPSYGSVYAQSPSSHTQTAPSGTFRPAVGSPPSRHNSIAYGSRQGPPTPVQSQTNLLGLASRPPASTAPYASSVQTTTAPPSHMSAHASGHQTYQQHVQTMVNGAHQQQPHRPSLGLSAGYGHNTPPPQAQASRATGLPGPASSATMGRSYTPPAILQPNPANYGGPPGMHPLQARPSGPGSLAESLSSAHNPGHQRGYSQGSNAGHPGGMAPQHPPR
ncbi:hypothetical protein CNMCM6106_007838 [Aspergillus hiratsukae]|uniref:SANT domain-containing protein n=1 Tax=Aspergillus hiratsukae TaxID=1194566 RepID=A0A8H6PJM9_9EURO|nr:hypothetical protein CNMCM6106_007838 [Aspergillus hiratsukae]